MATTLQTLREDVYDILNSPSDGSDDAFPTDYINRLLNEAQIFILGNHPFYFMREKQLFTTITNTTLEEAVATTDTTIELSSGTNYDNNSAMITQDDIIDYTGLSTNQLTGVTNIDIAHDAGSDVAPLYSLPSDFGRQEQLTVNGTVYDYIDDSDPVARSLWWTIEIDKSQNRYIHIASQTGGTIMVFKYYKIPTTMTASVNCTVPDEWAREILPAVAAGRALIQRDQPEDGNKLLTTALGPRYEDNFFEGTYARMINFYKKQVKGFRKKFKSTYQQNKFDI